MRGGVVVDPGVAVGAGQDVAVFGATEIARHRPECAGSVLDHLRDRGRRLLRHAIDHGRGDHRGDLGVSGPGRAAVGRDVEAGIGGGEHPPGWSDRVAVDGQPADVLAGEDRLAQQRPRGAAVSGLQDSLTGLRVDATVGFAGSGVDDLARGIDGERPDRQRRLPVGERRPAPSTVRGLPDSAARRTQKDDGGVRRIDRHARDPTAGPAVIAGRVAAALLIRDRGRTQRCPAAADHAVSLRAGRSAQDGGGGNRLGAPRPDRVMLDGRLGADRYWWIYGSSGIRTGAYRAAGSRNRRAGQYGQARLPEAQPRPRSHPIVITPMLSLMIR